ncbi:unnamed protein product, partial [Urochloa humidicola]
HLPPPDGGGRGGRDAGAGPVFVWLSPHPGGQIRRAAGLAEAGVRRAEAGRAGVRRGSWCRRRRSRARAGTGEPAAGEEQRRPERSDLEEPARPQRPELADQAVRRRWSSDPHSRPRGGRHHGMAGRASPRGDRGKLCSAAAAGATNARGSGRGVRI